MRLTILSLYYHPETGAPQVRLRCLAQALRRHGVQVEVVTALPSHPIGRIFPAWRGRFWTHEDDGGVPIERIWAFAALGSGWRRLLNYLSFTVTALLPLLARPRRPDLVLVESPPLFLALTARLYCWIRRTRYLFNVADLWPDAVVSLGHLRQPAARRLAGRLERWSYAGAWAVNAVTEGIRTVLRRRKRVPAARILFLPNGVDLKLFQPLPPDPALAAELGVEGRTVIVYAGTLGYVHGVETALLAMHRLQTSHPELCLLCVGGGSDRDRLVARAAALGLANVRFVPPRPVEDVPRLYALAVAGLVSVADLPVCRGARPSKMFPAMGCAKPVVYCGVGEGASLVAAAGAGLVVAPGEAAALAAAFVRLSSDPVLAARLGSQGRRFVETHLGWDGLIADWLDQLRTRHQQDRS